MENLERTVPACLIRENPDNKPIYVRAVMRLRKQMAFTLLSFTIVRDFNEIARHNLDIALRYRQRIDGLEVLQSTVSAKPKLEQTPIK